MRTIIVSLLITICGVIGVNLYNSSLISRFEKNQSQYHASLKVYYSTKVSQDPTRISLAENDVYAKYKRYTTSKNKMKRMENSWLAPILLKKGTISNILIETIEEDVD